MFTTRDLARHLGHNGHNPDVGSHVITIANLYPIASFFSPSISLSVSPFSAPAVDKQHFRATSRTYVPLYLGLQLEIKWPSEIVRYAARPSLELLKRIVGRNAICTQSREFDTLLLRNTPVCLSWLEN